VSCCSSSSASFQPQAARASCICCVCETMVNLG
jgi:hypothetical protein